MLLKFTNPRLHCRGPSVWVDGKFDLGFRLEVLPFFFFRWLGVHAFHDQISEGGHFSGSKTLMILFTIFGFVCWRTDRHFLEL